jgi:hypothetical protein
LQSQAAGGRDVNVRKTNSTRCTPEFPSILSERELSQLRVIDNRSPNLRHRPGYRSRKPLSPDSRASEERPSALGQESDPHRLPALEQ